MASYTRWWIQLGGKTIGPVSSRELRQMASAGRIDERTPVSPDRNQWRPANNIQELQFGEGDIDNLSTPPPLRPCTENSAQPDNSRRTTTLVFWIASSVLITLTAAVGLFMIMRDGHVEPKRLEEVAPDRILAKRRSTPQQNRPIRNRAERRKVAKLPRKPDQKKSEQAVPPRAKDRQKIPANKAEPARSKKLIRRSLAESVLKVSSTAYNVRGFNDYRFGSTVQQVQQLTVLKGSAEHKWVAGRDAAFYFADGRLRGIRKVYSGDNAAYVKALAKRFGKCPAADLSTFRATRADRVGVAGDYRVLNTTKQEVRANYRFPTTLVYLRAHVRTTSNTSTEWVEVTLLDRKWVIGILEQDIREKRKIIKSAKRIADYCRKERFDWDGIPQPPTTKAISGIVNRRFKVRAFLGKRGGDFENRINSAAAFSVREGHDGAVAVRIECYCAPGYDPHPLLAYPGSSIAPPRVLHDDMTRCNVHLMQSAFPSQDGSVRVRSRHNGTFGFTKAFEWRASNGWTVYVERNNAIVVVKTRNTGIKL